MSLRPTSFRNRLVLGAAAVGLLFAVLFGVVATWLVSRAEDRAIRAALESRLELARDEVQGDGRLREGSGAPPTDLVQVLGPDGEVRASTAALRQIGPLVDVSAVVGSSRPVEARVSLQRPDTDLATIAVPLELEASGTSESGTGALVAALDAEGFSSAATYLRGLLVAGLGAVVLAVTALSWVLTGRALTTVARITEAAEALRAGDLSSGLPVPAGDDGLARLVEALNRMLARLHASHATELAFASDAGHRLRTPVATLRAEAELALGQTDPDELTAALQRVIVDADQLTSIVNRMLARSRSRAPVPVLVRRELDEASTRWRRQAELAGVRLEVSVDGTIPPDAGTAGLVEVAEPILENAVRHAPPGGSVVVEARPGRPGGDTLVVSVANTGEPVAPETVEHLFDAWVSTRDASVAGGLGLWLARETARDAGGDVRHLERDGATVFEIELPLLHLP